MDRPAIHRGARAELIATARQLAARLRVQERTNLATAVELGSVLKALREGSAVGEYTEAIEKLALPRQRAWEFMRVASPPPDISDCDSIRHAIDRCALWDKQHPEKKDGGGGIRHAHDVPDTPSPQCGAPSAGREPGDDSEQIEAARKAAKAAGRNGRPLFEWRRYDAAFALVMRLPDDLGRAVDRFRDSALCRELSATLDRLAEQMEAVKKEFLR